MNKLTVLISFLLFFSSFNVNGQNNTDPNITQDSVQRTEEYAMVVASSRFLSLKVSIAVDYGQERRLFRENRLVKDDDGKLKAFNSVIDALNYMNEEGWEFVNAYSITVGNQNVYHYVMRRKITN